LFRHYPDWTANSELLSAAIPHESERPEAAQDIRRNDLTAMWKGEPSGLDRERYSESHQK